jgi:hypothetical protein
MLHDSDEYKAGPVFVASKDAKLRSSAVTTDSEWPRVMTWGKWGR